MIRPGNPMSKPTPMKFINLSKNETAPALRQPIPQSMPLKKAEEMLTESERRFCDAHEVSGVEDTLTSLKNR